MLPDDVSPTLQAGKEWRTWQRKLDNFLAWREQKRGPQAAQCAAKGLALHRRLAELCRLGSIEGWVLDVGCGTGGTRRFVHPGATYVGLDPVPLPGQDEPFRLVQGVGERLPFQDEVFSAVLTLGTLPHVLKPERVIAEMARVAQPGAIIGVEVPRVPRPRRSWKAKVKYAIQRVEQVARRAPNPTDPRLHWDWTAQRLQDLVAPLANIDMIEQVFEGYFLLVGRVR